jgi:hypothetical protein
MDNLGKTDQAIVSANRRLKLGELGISIQRMGASLYLVATLPPRPNADRTDDHQQRISLRLKANPASVGLAENEARIVSGKIAAREFDWMPYLKGIRQKPETAGEWVERFTREFEDTVSVTTWRSDYRNVLNKLPPDAPLTEQVLRTAIDGTKIDSKQRKRFCLTLGRLARFAGLEVNFKGIQGKYSESHTEPRDLPEDNLIAECFYSIDDPGWRWVFGAIATFGLRNHEVFYLDIQSLQQGSASVWVTEGKTGARQVWAFYPEWIDDFDLKKRVLPKVTGKTHEDFGRRVSKFFGRAIPFECYNLRHRWAVRTLEFGLDPTLAARQMGHSVAVHERTYHRWIDAGVHERAYKALTMSANRPQPPERREG